MKKLLILLMILLFSACTNNQPVDFVEPEPIGGSESEMVHNYGDFVDEGYEGYYFFVAPPEDFFLLEEAEDYASFISPDGKVVFAIYSPLWYGEGKEIIPQEAEEELDREVKESVVATSEIGPNANRIDTYITVKAKDDSYTRSLVEIVFENDDYKTQRIFSYQYKDQESYDEYLDKYLEFKESLVQYADGRFN